MKKIFISIFIISVTFIFASTGLDIAVNSSLLFFNRGDQELVTLEEIQGDIVELKNGELKSALDESTLFIRTFNDASLKLKVGNHLKFYTRLRHTYSFYEDDMYTPFSLNRFYGEYKTKALKIRAGRFFSTEKTIRRSIDGIEAEISYFKKFKTKIAYGATAPSPYDTDAGIMPDFYNKQFVLIKDQISLKRFGKYSIGYTMEIDEDAEEQIQNIASLGWHNRMWNSYVSLYADYKMTEGRFGNSYMNISKSVGEKLFLNFDYRMVLQKNWLIDDEYYFSGYAYDVFQAGAFYTINSHLGFEISELYTLYKDENYSHTFLEAIVPYGAFGMVFINTPDGSEMDFSLRLNHTFFHKLNLDGGVNYIAEQVDLSGIDNESGFGSYFAVNYKVMKDLNIGLNVFQMSSPNFDSHFRGLFQLNYRLSL